MMSPRSSISSSRAARYLLVAASSALAAVGALAVLSFLTLQNGWAQWHFAQLYEYQLEKVARLPKGDVGIVLLGDSSLGNGISARQWQEALGRRVTSLALTGVYGYAGSLNMLRRVLRKGKPDLVVLVNTAEMMSRNVAHEGLIYSASSVAEMEEAPIGAFLGSLVNFDLPLQGLRTIIFGRPAVPAGLREADYIVQGPPLPSTGGVSPLRETSINPAKTYYLRKIGDLCKAEGLTCVYMHGPYANPACEESGAYFRRANEVIRRQGLKVVDQTPVCIAPSDIGDAADHVAAAHRRHYSSIYLKRLLKALGASSNLHVSPKGGG